MSDKKLFLLDGMALVYRAHFAFASRPIFTSKGVNTSALYGYTNTLVDLINNQKPTHLAVAFDTAAPTERHEIYPEYKANREEMPEDLSDALPVVRGLTEAFKIPVLTLDGYEADDIIGTLTLQAEAHGFQTFMVTPDKDFGQLVSDQTFLYRPSRMGDGVEIQGVQEVLAKWGIARVDQVIDMLGLCGDTADNIPGVPGIGPKTAQKLLAIYDTIEGLLERVDELKGKQKERLEEHREQALLSKRLATIQRDVPLSHSLEAFQRQEPDKESLKAIFVEFEFNAIGKRLFGDEFHAGRGTSAESDKQKPQSTEQTELIVDPDLKTIDDFKPNYRAVQFLEEVQKLVGELQGKEQFCFDLETTSLDTKHAQIVGIALSWEPRQGVFVTLPGEPDQDAAILNALRPVLQTPGPLKIGHNLKYDIGVLSWHEVTVEGPYFDTMVAHALIEPDLRHTMDYLAESLLGYRPIPISQLIGDKKSEQISMRDVPLEALTRYAAEDSDITLQLHDTLRPLLAEKKQEAVFYDIEMPLIPALVAMEHEGVRLDTNALARISETLATDIQSCQARIFELAEEPFNLNSPKQLGEVLFDRLKIADKPKKTRTGQYATNEQTLISLSGHHEIIDHILEYRGLTKLKSTYVDTLPNEVLPESGRVHTTYNQAVTVTGRLQSQNPNLQNIPIRTDKGREIRRAFIARDEDHWLLAADYSQIELRILAALSQDPGMLEAFRQDQDIHAATAAKIYGVPLDAVETDMRRKAKMVNFGLAYGMSAFGLSQRLGIPRAEAKDIMNTYFEQFPGIQVYMKKTIADAKEKGFVQTVSGRRRYLRDIRSANATTRGAAERNAINMPIQGTAADLIKVAMAKIHQRIRKEGHRSRMLLQVHDELVFDMPHEEQSLLTDLVREEMQNAIDLGVEIKVDIGIGPNWLAAH